MALEDFFTLSEMKDGLTTLARVEELISVMKKEKESVISSVAESARQWSSVARILSASENKDCLIYFIQLNGLFYLNQWLQEAQKYSSDASDGSAEELINLLLGALQVLPVNRENSLSSGIGMTVKQVICLNIPNAKDRANTLLAKWDLLKDDNIDSQDQPTGGKVKGDERLVQEDMQTLHPALDTFSSKKIIGESGNNVESTDKDSSHLIAEGCIDVSKPESNAIMELSSTTQHMPHASTLTESDKISGDVHSLASSISSNPCQESLLGKESSSGPAVGVSHADRNCPSFSGEIIVEGQSGYSQAKVTPDNSKEMEIEIDTKDPASCKEICIASSSGVPSSPLQVQKCMEPAEECKFDSEEVETIAQKSLDFQPRSGISDCERTKLRTLKEPKAHSKDISGVGWDANETHHGMELLRINDSNKETGISYRRDRKKVDSKGLRGYSNQAIGASTSVEIDRRLSDVRIDYGDDALEFAVQVAIEATRELADREQHSTSSEGRSEGEIMDSASGLEEKMGDKMDQSKSPSNEHSNDGSSSENSSRTSENIEGSENSARKLESPNSVPVIQESVENTEKTKPCFDLNEDVCDEDTDTNDKHPPFNSQSNLSVPIAVVATSKGTPGLPATPLHFEGELGWRGSAATSAFRPASPRKTPDGEKTVSGPKQKSSILQFDLNVADGEDDAVADPVLEKQIPASSGLPSGDSSVEVSSRRAEKFKLDLNHGLGDGDTLPNASSYWKLPQQNGNGSLSPISLSSVRQHSMRDFDLNDNPSFLDACSLNSLNKPSKDASKRGSFKVDDPVITIMGSRMSVEERRESTNQVNQPFLANGLGLDSTMTARPSMVYPHITPPAYGYNGLAMAPNLSLPPALYGPGSIPYMVDSRGATVIPQLYGSSAELNGSSSARPPFLVNVAGSPPGLGPIGAPRPTLDLNSGMLSLDSGNREMGSFGQLYLPWHGGLSEEQMRAAPHTTPGPGMTLKRKEPECGWESYPVGYKQVTSWP